MNSVLFINNPRLNVRPAFIELDPSQSSTLSGEWDLNDPDRMKKDMPARVSDDDPRCGIASLQKFQGEDLNARARMKYQQEQLREWSRMQQENQQRAQQQQETADRLFYAKQNELDQRAVELQRAEEECRRAINQSMRDYNEALVSDHAALPSF